MKRKSALFFLGLALVLNLSLLIPASVFADASGPLSPFPLTGAYTAKFIEDRDHVSIIEISGNYNKSLDSGQANAEPRAIIAKEFFRTHPDNYDFIVAFSDFEFDTGDAAAFHWGLQNKTEGLGIPIYDITDLFGSNGKLQGFTDMAALTRWTTDPLNPKFEHTLSVLAHEILHQWGPRIRFKLPDGSVSDALLGRDGAHWSYLLDSDASVEYGAEWSDNGDGTFTATGIRTFYSALDLYLMGMYGTDEVPPITLINNPAIDKTQLPQENVTISGVKQTVTIDDIIAAEGARNPAATSAQKSFRFAFVFLTGPNKASAVTDAQILALNNIRNAFMTRFAVLTGGRGIAQVYPEGLPTSAPGTPDTLPGGDIRTTPVNYEDALAWLRGRQDVLGYWSDKETTRIRDTAVVLDTLTRLDPQFSGETTAVNWLNGQLDKNSDYLARHLAVTSSLGNASSDAVSELLLRQNADGGWGIAGDFQSNPLDTALAITALTSSAAASSTGEISKAAEYLSTAQNSDGGWGVTGDGKSLTSVTAHVLKALKNAGLQTGVVRDKALTWLASKQNADGGFGDSPSTVHDSALALSAFIESEALDYVQSDAVANYLLGLQGLDGSWQDSTYATALAVSVLKRFNFSNFAVRNPLTVTSSVIHDGERVMISGVVVNESNVPTEPNSLRVYRSDANGVSEVLGSDISLPVIPAGSTVAFSKSWDSFGQMGTQTFIAVADPDGTAVEMSELDNSAKITVEVQSALTGVELEITDSDIVAIPNHPDSLPTLMGISANVRNIGDQDGQNIRVVLWDGDVGTGVIVDEVLLDILARTSVTANFNYTLTKPGLTNLTVQIDPYNAIPESNKGNNLASIDVITLPTIDVAVTAPDISINQSPALFGEDAVFSVKLHNNGTLDSPNTVVNYLVTDGVTTKALATNTVFLKPGETLTQSITWRVDMTGPLTFSVLLDPDALIVESDVTNNSASFDFTSGQNNGPNLIVSHTDFTFMPEPGKEGSQETLKALVRNIGDQAATNVAVDFYNGDPKQNGVRIGERYVIPTLAGAGEALVTLDWTAIPDSTDKLLFVVVDPDNTILESNENDNSAFNTLTVLSLPDLSIASGDIDVSPGFPVAGETVIINARVSNLGQQSANSISVRAFNGDPASGGNLIGETTLSSLDRNSADIATFSMTLDPMIESTMIVVQVNPHGDILERFTSNNSAEKSITVQNSDLYISPFYFSPNGDGIQDETSLFFRFDVAVTVTIEVVNESERTIRTIKGMELENITAGNVVWDGLDQLGKLVPDGDYRIRIVDNSGVILGEKSVVLDTNRSPLVKAMGTKYGHFTNLTCEAPITLSPENFTVDGRSAFYFINTWEAQSSGYPAGIYRMTGIASDAELILPGTWFTLNGYHDDERYISIAQSPDGKMIYFTALTSVSPNETHIWSVSSDGKAIKRLDQNIPLNINNPNIYVSPDGDKVYIVDHYASTGMRIVQASYANSNDNKVLLDVPSVSIESINYSRSSGKFAYVATMSNDTEYQTYIFDPELESEIPIGERIIFRGDWGDIHYNYSMQWSPDGKKLAVGITDPLSSWGPPTPNDLITITAYGGQGDVLAQQVINEFLFEAPLFSWAADSTEFAVAMPMSVMYGEGYEIYDGDMGGVYVMGLAPGQFNKVLAFDYYSESPLYSEVGGWNAGIFWVPNDRVLLIGTGYYSRDMHAIYLNEDNRVEQYMFPEYSEYEPNDFPAFIGVGDKLLFKSYKDGYDQNSACYGKGYNDSFIFESLLNMKADLRVLRSSDKSGLRLLGTASDLNFENYKLEYAHLDAPDIWQPVSPSSTVSVVDNSFTTWIPPAPGVYLVRLTVHDLAGNTQSIIKRASWNEEPSITDLYRLPAYISPNSDGIQDEAQIHYRVLEPVHLEFNFYDETGNRVRTITRDESVSGAEVNIYWDGRDDNGIILPDGKYQFEVMNYQFSVWLDATPPTASIFFKDAYQSSSDGLNVAVAPAVFWASGDTNFLKIIQQMGIGNPPAIWSENTNPIMRNKQSGMRPLKVSDYVNNNYRIQVYDKAGNVSVATTEPAKQQLVIEQFGTLALNSALQEILNNNFVLGFSANQIKEAGGLFSYIDLSMYAGMENDSPEQLTATLSSSLARVAVAETIRDDVANIYYQYREVDAVDWHEGVVDQYLTRDYEVNNDTKSVEFVSTSAIPDESLAIKLPLTGLNPGKSYYLRLRAVDISGVEFVSNTIMFYVGNVVLNGLVMHPDRWNENRSAIWDAASRMNPPPSDWSRIIFGEEYIKDRIAEAVLYVQSKTDARYATEKVIDRIAYPNDKIILFRGDILESCHGYTARMLLLAEPDTNGFKKPLGQARAYFEIPCISVTSQFNTRSAQACGEPAPNIIDISLSLKSYDGTGLKLLTLSRLKPGVGEDVLFNVNDPVNDGSYEFPLNTNEIPEGEVEFTARLVDINDNIVTNKFTVIIDHTPPDLTFVYPLDGQHVCGVPREGSDGVIRNVVTLDADVSDLPANSSWRYKVGLGAGMTPTVYETIHDSLRGPDSFVVASGGVPSEGRSSGFTETVDHVGPIAEVFDRTGTYTARLMVMDTGGYMRCTERVFHMDTEVSPLPPTIDYGVFSPNGDGIADDVTISYLVDESVTLDVTIYNAASGTPIRHLESNKSILPGSSSSVWDGKDDSGAIVTDGPYKIVIGYKDACANLAKDELEITVDNTPPAVAISYPLPGDPLSMIVNVAGSVSDVNLMQHSLEYGVGKSPVDYVPIARGDYNVPVPQVLAEWNTFGLVGEYTLRLRSTDLAGNESITTSLVNLAVKVNLLNGLEAVPPLFSPNGDGRREQSVINVGVEKDVLLSLGIYDTSGVLVATLAQDVALGVGGHTFTWDGLNNNGDPSPDKSYVVKVTAQLADNPLVTQDEEINIELDSTPPLVDVSANLASGFVHSDTAISGTISDKNLKTYTLELTDTPQQPVWTTIATGSYSQTNSVLASLNSLAEGKYALRVTAQDAAEIITQTIIPFEVDNTAPEVAILAPAANDVVGAKKAPVNINVSVTEPNLVAYTLNIGAGESPATWTELIKASILPVAEPLTVLDTAAYSDGVYTLQLTALDKAGNQTTKQQLVTIDNTPPLITVTSPTDGAYIKAADDVIGTVSDINLSQYRLLIVPGAKNQSSSWSELSTSSTAVDAGIIHHFTALPPDGLHTLKVEAKDKADNLSEYLIELTVDTIPPSPPTGLAASIENKQDIRLTWNQNPEPDLAGYHVYRDGVQISTSMVTTPEYVDANVAEGRYTYTVVAVDKAQWFSEQSAGVQVMIDVTPPLTSINQPADLSTVSGLQQIVGTAYSVDDFKEYRLYVADAAQPQDWVLLRRSPVPTLGDILADWNTLTLAEGAQFLLKLEGEDINGNVATEQITVTIDNMPPAAPTGVVAVANGNDVSVSWNPNTEQDLFGYLVFRDDRLVNSDGAVIGDLRSYAITATLYNDLALPDGTYRYTVIAIDQAGNISVSSLPSEVSIDTKPPHAIITEPVTATVFEKPLYLLAQSDDGDIASVEFQYRSVGATTWNILSITGSRRPYDTTLDPLALGLEYGDYELRSVATDLGSKVDPDPGFITVTYKDVTPPAPVVGITTKVNGGDVTVSWVANTDTDLAGYFVYRVDDFGNAQQLNNVPISELLYLEQGLFDALYRYKVSAVDLSGNVGQASPIADALVYTPTLAQPYTPTGDAFVTVQGTGKTEATVSGQIVSGATSNPLPEVLTDANFNFAVTGIPLQEGDNTVTVVLTDNFGNVSKTASTNIFKASAPSKPTGLTATANGFDVSLAWNANPETNIVGYRAFRNSTPLLTDVSVPLTNVSAFTNTSYAWRMTDGSMSSYWWAYIYGVTEADSQWIRVGWGQQRVITEVDVSWYYNYSAYKFDIEAWSGTSWIKLKQISANTAQQSKIILDKPYVTDQIRIIIHSARNGRYVYISDIDVMSLGLTTELTYIDPAPGGAHEYTVTAVNSAGLESVPSDIASVSVGDVTPPEPVVLSASVADADVTLAWDASVSTDISHYVLYRDGEQIFQQNDLAALTYIDAGRPNGTYNYTVEAVDLSGNVSPISNTATAVVDIVPPAAPNNLVVTVDPNGNALDLSWAPPTGATPASYNILRSLTAGGPYSLIGASTVTSYQDTGLVNQTTYYYVVAAVDKNGNQGLYSNEAFGTPIDQIAPVVTITYPARAGQPHTTDKSSTNISGITDPGAMVTLNQDGLDGGQTVALTADSVKEYDLQMWVDDLAVSPDGQYAIVASDSIIYLRNLASGNLTSIYNVGTYDSQDMRWSAKSNSVVVRAFDPNSYRYNLVKLGAIDGTATTLLAADEISDSVYSGVLSPNEDVLLYSAWSGVWKKDLATGIHTQLNSDRIDYRTLKWSPDGVNVAYFTSYPYTLRILNTVSGSTVDVSSEYSSGKIDWSMDGSQLLYTSYPDDVSSVIKRYDIVSGISDVVHGIAGSYLHSPTFSPDERMVAYIRRDQVDYTIDLQVLNLNTDEVRVVDTTDYPFVDTLQWSVQNQLFIWVDDSLINLIHPAGKFEFTDVRLHGGDNVFAAKAQDQYLNISGLSDSVVINYALGEKPDLQLDVNSIVNIPSAPISGEPVRVTVTVNNVGLADAPPSSLDVLVLDAAGNSTSLGNAVSVPVIKMGSQWSASFDWVAPDVEGVFRVIAIVDANDEIVELSESNNQAIKSFLLATTARPVIDMVLERTAYGSNDVVSPSVTVQNSGNVFDGELTVFIEDDGGYLVKQILSQTIANLGYGETFVVNPIWDTGSTFAGNYQVHAQLLDAQKQLLGEQLRPFSILENTGLTSSITTDKTVYPANSNLLASGSIAYTGGNVLLDNLSSILSISDMSGNVVVEQSNNLGTLLPEDSVSTQLAWNTELTPPGSYIVKLDVLRNATNVSSATTTITIEKTDRAVSGTLSAPLTRIGVGDAFAIDYGIRNMGNAAVNGLPITISLYEPTTHALIDTRTTTAPQIPVGERYVGSVSFDSSTLALGVYSVELFADVLQADGTVKNSNLASIGIQVVDRSLPVVTILKPVDGEFLGATGLFSISAHDIHSSIVGVGLSIDAQPWIAVNPSDRAKGIYGKYIYGLTDGSHTAVATAADSWGNMATSTVTNFIVDTLPPEIVVTGVADGGIYNTSVIPVITITDENLATQSITLNGAPYISGTAISAEDVYLLEVSATDKAGNVSQFALSFILDKAPPQITVSGVSDAGIYNTSVTPVIVVTDPNLLSQTVQLNGVPYVSGTAISAEGAYTLDITATDKAGNVSQLTLSFVIDMTPPTIAVTGVVDAGIYNTSVIPVITITDANLSTQSITLNGAPYVSGTAISAEDAYTLKVVATDKAGNRAQLSFSFVIDLTPPDIIVTGVADGEIYNASVKPVVSVTDTNLSTQLITLNGASYVSDTTISTDNDYVLMVIARDLAGNIATRTINFAIDTVPPVIVINGVQDGQYANAPVTPIITVSDAHLATQTMTLNGAPYVSGTTITADGDYVLTVNAQDRAGNAAAQTVSFTIDTVAPVITIDGVQDGMYFNQPLTPVITVTDANLLSQSITLNNAPYVSGTTVSAEGTYVLSAYAVDKAGNSTRVTLNFTIDKTSPQITITGVEEGGLYNKSVTPQIKVYDANMGDFTATLNGEPYISGTAISADSDYMLTVNAQDLAGNTSVFTLGFTVDTTPPIVTITSPLEGEVLAVDTVTVAGTTEPMSTVYLSLNGYLSSAVSNAFGGFDFNGVPLNEGENAISIYAIDAAGNIGEVVTVTVMYIPIELTGTLHAPDDVLIYANRQHEEDEHKDCDKDDKKHFQENHHEKHDSCKSGKTYREDLLNSLTAVLGGMQTDFLVARDEHELVTALRSQNYGTLVILETSDGHVRKHGDEHHEYEVSYRLDLDDELRNEISAMVASGMGLAWIKTHPDSNEHWAELFGAEIKGKLPRITGIELNGNLGNIVGAYAVSGSAVRVKPIATSVVAGTLLPTQSPAIVVNSHGSGKTLLGTFNPVDIADIEARKEMLGMILHAVRTIKEQFVPGDVAEIEWAVDKIHPPVRLEINEYLDPDAYFMSVVNGDIVNETHARWIDDVLQVSKKYAALVRLPSTMGDYRITTDVSLLNGDTPYATLTREISYRLAINETTLASDILASMMNMEAANERERHHIRKAIHYFQEALQKELLTQQLAEEAIESLTESLAHLQRMEISTDEIAEKIGYLLRIYQLKWGELPSVEHTEDSHHKHDDEKSSEKDMRGQPHSSLFTQILEHAA